MSKRNQRRIENRARLDRSVVHILYHGFPACGFCTLAPGEWPEGHRWMGVNQPRHKVSCMDCLKAAKEGGF